MHDLHEAGLEKPEDCLPDLELIHAARFGDLSDGILGAHVRDHPPFVRSKLHIPQANIGLVNKLDRNIEGRKVILQLPPFLDAPRPFDDDALEVKSDCDLLVRRRCVGIEEENSFAPSKKRIHTA